MKGEKLISNGVEYPVTLNYYSMKEWEIAKGKKMSAIMNGMRDNETESDTIIQMAELCYYGVKEEYEEQNIDFNLTEKQFIRGLDGGQIERVIKISTDFLNPKAGESTENNGQPKKQTRK